GTGVTEDVLLRLFPRNVLSSSADHDRQLRLMIDSMLQGGEANGIAGSHHRGGGYQEQQRLLGQGFALLLGMFPIIEADGDQFVGPQGGKKPDLRFREALPRFGKGIEKPSCDGVDEAFAPQPITDGSPMLITDDLHRAIPFFGCLQRFCRNPGTSLSQDRSPAPSGLLRLSDRQSGWPTESACGRRRPCRLRNGCPWSC